MGGRRRTADLDPQPDREGGSLQVSPFTCLIREGQRLIRVRVYAGLQRLFRIRTDQVIECSGCGYKATSDPGFQHILNLPLQKSATLNGHYVCAAVGGDGVWKL